MHNCGNETYNWSNLSCGRPCRNISMIYRLVTGNTRYLHDKGCFSSLFSEEAVICSSTLSLISLSHVFELGTEFLKICSYKCLFTMGRAFHQQIVCGSHARISTRFRSRRATRRLKRFQCSSFGFISMENSP